MTKEKKKSLRRLRYLLSRILSGLSWLVLTAFAVIIFIMDFGVKSWFFSLFQGLFAIFFLAVLPSMLDLRPDTRVEENGIWFRDYKVMIPYSYMEKGEFYKGRSHGCTEYEVDIFLSSKVVEDGQINTCKLQKKLKGENKIRVLLLEDQEEEYVSLCAALRGKIPMRDVSEDDISK